MAHGGAERGAAESEPASAGAEAGINCGKALKTLEGVVNKNVKIRIFLPLMLYTGIGI